MDNNDMYQNEQPTGAEPENNQFTNNNYNSNYQQYPYNNYNGNYQVPYQQNSPLDLEEPMKVSEWLISFLILLVPCVNIVMVFVWAFGSTEKKSKSNYFKAYLIFMGIILALYLVLIMVIAALGISYGLHY